MLNREEGNESESSSEEEEELADLEATSSSSKPDDIASIYKRRFCKTCFIWRPALASHCRYCDQCVTHFDHHCFLVNTCIGRRNMRNFVVFVNSIFLTCLLYVTSHLRVICPHLLLSKDHSTVKHDNHAILTLDLVALAAISLLELLLPKTRWLNCLLALAYILDQSQLMFGTLLTADLIYLVLFTMTCFGLGTSLSYVLTYLKLTYQGFTKKELRSVEFETERQVKWIDLRRGLGNMMAFYIKNSSDRERGASELQKRF